MKNNGYKQLVSEDDYINEAFKDESLKNNLPKSKENNRSVIASVHS